MRRSGLCIHIFRCDSTMKNAWLYKRGCISNLFTSSNLPAFLFLSFEYKTSQNDSTSIKDLFRTSGGWSTPWRAFSYVGRGSRHFASPSSTGNSSYWCQRIVKLSELHISFGEIWSYDEVTYWSHKSHFHNEQQCSALPSVRMAVYQK